MVYQDYEIIATKRVGHSRSKPGLLLKAQFNAAGGWNTVYMMAFLSGAGKTFGWTTSSPLARPLMSAAGVSSVLRNTVTSSGPALVGLMLGVSAFGNGSELYNLIRNAPKYSSEFKAV